MYLQGFPLCRVLCCLWACVFRVTAVLPAHDGDGWKLLSPRAWHWIKLKGTVDSPRYRLRIKFVRNWFKPGGVYVERRQWWEGMIRFVLSLFFPLCWCQQIRSALPCQHKLLVEQSKLICRCATCYFLSSPRYSIPFLLVCPLRCFDTKRWVILFHHWSILSDFFKSFPLFRLHS